MNLESQKHLYQLEDKVTFLNGAYMSPMLKEVEQIGIDNILKKRTPSSFGLGDFFGPTEELKEAFAKLINADDPQKIVPIGSASYGLATVATNISFQKGDKIALLADQFPSNYYIWERVAKDVQAQIITIGPKKDGEGRGRSWNENIIESISKEIKVLAMSHVHWADGTLFDLEKIRVKCEETGTLLIIDGTQSIGALPFDQEIVKADAVICAGYKWLHGPYGLGVAYYGDKFLEGRPIEESWINRYNSQDFKNLVNYQQEYRKGAQRFAVGESSNFILLPMLVKAIEQLNEWTPHGFQGYCMSLADHLVDIVKPMGFWIEEKSYRSSHLFGIKVPQIVKMAELKDTLSEENISVSFRGKYIRVSPGVYNTIADIEKFAKCLARHV